MTKSTSNIVGSPSSECQTTMSYLHTSDIVVYLGYYTRSSKYTPISEQTVLQTAADIGGVLVYRSQHQRHTLISEFTLISDIQISESFTVYGVRSHGDETLANRHSHDWDALNLWQDPILIMVMRIAPPALASRNDHCQGTPTAPVSREACRNTIKKAIDGVDAIANNK